MTQSLSVLLGGVVAGTLTQGRSGILTFTYAPSWRERPDAYSISLSLPLAQVSHVGPAVRHYLAGLLPDNDRILETWGRQFGVSPRNPFALLTHIGEDCAGAVQFVEPDRVPTLQSRRIPSIEWLTDHEIGQRLAALQTAYPTGRRPDDAGYFSLPGAQPKIALFYDAATERWGIPSGRTPTTHILKPPTASYEGFLENEYLCAQLMRAAGLPSARSTVQSFGGYPAIVIERYDRLFLPTGLTRVHQEDTCQALALAPANKYENEGGPGIAEIVTLLRAHSTESARDVATFLDAVAINWIIGGPDAHGKNYSLLIAPGQVRLAPLYDIISGLPYPALNTQKFKLAMKIGGEYRVHAIKGRHWDKLASELAMDAAQLALRVRQLSELVAEQITPVCAEAKQRGIRHPILQKIEKTIRTHAARCATLMKGYRGAPRR